MDVVVDIAALTLPLPFENPGVYDSHSPLIISSQQRIVADIQLVACHPQVYEPSDDSFALVDALLSDRTNLKDLHPRICLEIGSGSGYVITSLALLLGNSKRTEYIATDVSEAAANATFATLRAHNVNGEVFVTDLVSGLEERLEGVVDVLVFNPPYIPTSEEDAGSDDITFAWWAGGNRGRMVIDRMLEVVDMLLSSKGVFYLVTITVNNPGEICQFMRRKGFDSRIVVQRYMDEESLHVLKFWRDQVFKEWSDPAASSSPASSAGSLMSQCMSWFFPIKE